MAAFQILTQFEQVQQLSDYFNSSFASDECFLLLDLHCCQNLNFPCFTFCTFSFAKPIQKIELRSNFHQDKFCAKEASLGSLNAIVHIFKITKILNFKSHAFLCVQADFEFGHSQKKALPPFLTLYNYNHNYKAVLRQAQSLNMKCFFRQLCLEKFRDCR